MDSLERKRIEEVSTLDELKKIIDETTNKEFKEYINEHIETADSQEKKIDSFIDSVEELVSSDFEWQESEEALKAFEESNSKLAELTTLDDDAEATKSVELESEEKSFYLEYKDVYTELYKKVEQDVYIQVAEVQKEKREAALVESVPLIAEESGPFKRIIQKLHTLDQAA